PLASLVLRDELLVDLPLEPRAHLDRLALGQGGAHRKAGLGQIDGFLELHWMLRPSASARCRRSRRLRRRDGQVAYAVRCPLRCAPPMAIARSGLDPAIEVRPVRGKKDIETFLHVPWKLGMKEDPNWVPPLLDDYRRQLDPRK